MELRDGAEVCTSDGRKIGRIDRVVIDPSNKEVTHIAVRKGTFLPVDKLVPVESIESATEKKITLRLDENGVNELPEFVEEHYVPVDLGEYPHGGPFGAPLPLYWYPPMFGASWGAPYGAPFGAPYGSPYLGPGYPIGEGGSSELPKNVVALKEGARVIASDGEEVGRIEQLFTEPSTDRATHLILRSGVLDKKRRGIPISWVDRIEEDEVRLHVGSKQVDSLPEHHEGAESGASREDEREREQEEEDDRGRRRRRANG